MKYCWKWRQNPKNQNQIILGLSWSWSYASWIYHYLSNQCLPLLKLVVRISLRLGVLDTTLCDKVWQWIAAGVWFSPGTPVSPTNKTDRHDIVEILLKVTYGHHFTSTNDVNISQSCCRIDSVSTHIYYMLFVGTVTTEATTTQATTVTTSMNFYSVLNIYLN